MYLSTETVFFCVALSSIVASVVTISPDQPHLQLVAKNVTAEVGQTAVLPCSVESLGDRHKVVWQAQSGERIRTLTMDIRRIINDDRISVERPYTREWNLHIRKINLDDAGLYNCIINTKPVQKKDIMLMVVESPKINEEQSSDSIVLVKEGDTVELICNATGTPAPEVIWRRIPLDGDSSNNRGFYDTRITRKACTSPKKVIRKPGSVLVIKNITRDCGDEYQCIAHNGVGTDAVHQMQVNVEFPPEVYLPTKVLSQSRGKATVLECGITAFPHNVNAWRRDGVVIPRGQEKYTIVPYTEDDNRITLTLRIHQIEAEDYGEYECFASNSMGADSQVMYLHELKVHTTTTTTTKSPESYPKYQDHNALRHKSGEDNNRRISSNDVKRPDYHRSQDGHDQLDKSAQGYKDWDNQGEQGYNRDVQRGSVIGDPNSGRNSATQRSRLDEIILTLAAIILHSFEITCHFRSS